MPHSTVSRALRNSPLVNPETGDRIREITRSARPRLDEPQRNLLPRGTEFLEALSAFPDGEPEESRRHAAIRSPSGMRLAE